MITVLGSISLDQIGAVERLPGPGETVLGGLFTTSPGGKGANQALAARRAGAEVRLVGAVGSDGFADPATALLRAGGIDLTPVRAVPGATGVAMVLVDASGENCIAVLPGANGALVPHDAEQALGALPPGSIVLLQQEIPQAATERALDIARARGLVSILNIAPFLETTAALARKASILIANETECALLAGDTADLQTAITEWSRHHEQTVIVTLGSKGVRAAHAAHWISVAALPIAPVDTVGAGDTFCGYLAAGLDEGLDLERAISQAAAAASLSCLSPGAQQAIPIAAYVAERIEALRRD